MPFATVTLPGKSVRYRTWSGHRQKEERYKMLESEIEPHAREARDARAFIIVCNARRAARNYSARGYGREPAPIPDTRGDDLNILQHDATLFRRNRFAAGRGTRHVRTGTSGERTLYER